MQIVIINNSLVILAEAHNPSLISDHFLLTSKIIDNPDIINRENSVITPVFVQISFKDSTSITLDPGRLAITARYGESPFLRGQNYCKSLPFIKGKAIGINFVVNVEEVDSNAWFSHHDNIEEAKCLELKYKFHHGNVTVGKINDTSVKLEFNFHYDLDKATTLGEVNLDFVKEWKKNYKLLNTFLNKSFTK